MKTKIYSFSKAVSLSLLMFISTLISATPIITEWNTNANTDGSSEILIDGNVAFSYTWVGITNPALNGSGTSNVAFDAPIIFPEVGNYQVSIMPGAGFRFSFSTAYPYTNNKKLSKIIQWGDGSWAEDLSAMFQYCSNLQITATDIPNFSNVTNMYAMFIDCRSLNTVPNMEGWNISNVTDLSIMFQNATVFNQPLGN